jgi:hypothetical protein
VFDGLNQAINGNIGWREHGVKVIILIGDASANVSEDKNPLNYTLNGLLTDANAKAIRIYAIKIDGEDTGDYETQENQWKELSDGLTPGTKGAYVRVSMGGESVDEYMEKLKSSIIKEFTLARKLKELAEKTSIGGPIIQAPDVSDAEFMVLKRLLDTSVSKDKTPGNDEFNFSTGWVQLDKDGIPVIETRIMISDGELELLSYMLDGLQIIMKGKSNVDKIKKTFVHDLESLSGESFNEEEETISDFLKKKRGIPIQTKLLRFTLAELREWSETQLKGRVENIGEKSKSLRAFRGDQSNWNVVTDEYSYAYAPIALLP